jgi:hypothetical protein
LAKVYNRHAHLHFVKIIEQKVKFSTKRADSHSDSIFIEVAVPLGLTSMFTELADF